MKHVKTLTTSTLKTSMAKGGCGECQTSCQSACKTSLEAYTCLLRVRSNLKEQF